MTITQHTRRRVFDAIQPKGSTLRQLSESSGVHISNVRMVAKLLEAEGGIFTLRAGTGAASKHEIWTFKTAEAREAFQETWLDEVARRQKARLDAKTAKRRAAREAEGRSMVAIAAERREARKRAERDRQDAERMQQAAQRKATQQKLRKMTAAAGAQVFKPGTLSPKPKKEAWAELPDPDLAGLPVNVVESKFRDRFAAEPEEVQPCFSSLKPGQYLDSKPRVWIAVAVA